MVCPQCGAEYRRGFTRCADCDVRLVEATAEDGGREAPHGQSMVPVFETTDPIVLPLVKSLLDSSDVPYVVQGEGALGLLPLGPGGQRVTRYKVGAIVYVREDYAEEVTELLRQLEEDFSQPADDCG